MAFKKHSEVGHQSEVKVAQSTEVGSLCLLQWNFPTQESNQGLLHCRLPTPVLLGFPCGSAGKESACNVGDLGSIPELGRSPGEGSG